MTGIVHITSSLNNTLLTLTDSFGNTKASSSCGSVGFRGSRRSTSYAAQAGAEALATKAKALGYFSVHVRVKGIGYGKESSVRGLQIGGLLLTHIEDVTPVPFNGCRPPKRRRT